VVKGRRLRLQSPEKISGEFSVVIRAAGIFLWRAGEKKAPKTRFM